MYMLPVSFSEVLPQKEAFQLSSSWCQNPSHVFHLQRKRSLRLPLSSQVRQAEIAMSCCNELGSDVSSVCFFRAGNWGPSHLPIETAGEIGTEWGWVWGVPQGFQGSGVSAYSPFVAPFSHLSVCAAMLSILFSGVFFPSKHRNS